MSQRKYSHIAGRVFDTPLLIQQSKLHAILNVLGPRLGFELDPAQKVMTSLDDGKPHDPFEHMEHLQALAIRLEPMGEGHFVGEGVALIPVYGTLVQRSDWLSDSSGMLSYSRIERMMNAALNDNRVKELIWEFDSPGGEVAGAFDMADRIYAARGAKPMTAVVNELAASAGYLLASSVGDISLSRTSMVGSIGVVAAHFDYSKAMEKRGVAVTYIYAGDKKVEGNPYEPLSPEAKAAWQEEINDSYVLFVETVARNTGLSTQKIRETQAAVFTGQKAVAAGLAQRINTFSNEVGNAVNRQRTGVIKPLNLQNQSAQKLIELGVSQHTINNWKQPPTTSKEPDMNEAEVRAKAEAEARAKVEADAKAAADAKAKAEADAKTAADNAVKAERERANAINALPEAKGREALARTCVEKGLSVEVSKEVLAAAPKSSRLDAVMEGLSPRVSGDASAAEDISVLNAPVAIESAETVYGRRRAAFHAAGRGPVSR